MGEGVHNSFRLAIDCHSEPVEEYQFSILSKLRFLIVIQHDQPKKTKVLKQGCVYLGFFVLATRLTEINLVGTQMTLDKGDVTCHRNDTIEVSNQDAITHGIATCGIEVQAIISHKE